MAPNRTALLSAITTSLLTTPDTTTTTHTPQSKGRRPYADSAFSSKRQRISSYPSHETIISTHHCLENSRPSTDHTPTSACSHPTIIHDAFRVSVSAFPISASPALLPAAVGCDSTVATTGSNIYHTLAGVSANGAPTFPSHASQHMLPCNPVLTSQSSSYPIIFSDNPVLVYTFHSQPMGSSLSALTWQSHLGTATTPPPLTANLEGYNSDSSVATNDIRNLSYPT
eukprot:scaffold33355_cov36-Attheya_sp.AAC.8